MTLRRRAAVRLWWTAVLAVVLGVLLAAAPAALAAGTGGIELTPIPGLVDGRQVTAFHVDVPTSGQRTVPFALRNVAKGPRTARLYAASADSDGHGSFVIGGAGSARTIRLPERTVRLNRGEIRAGSFIVLPDKHAHGTRYAAVVLEVQQGAIVQRAATLVYLQAGKGLSLPRVLVAVAGVFLAGIALALLFVVLRQRRRPSAA